MLRHRGPLLRLWASGFAALLFPGAAALAQGAPGPEGDFEVSARLDTDAASIGAPLTLTLRLRFPAEYSPLLPRMEEILPRQLAVEAAAPAVEPRPLSAGEVEAVATYRVRAFDLGELTIPPIPIRFAAAGKDTLLRGTAPLVLEIVPVRDPEDDELRDIVPPLVIAGGIPVWLIALLATLAAVAAAWILKVFYLDRRTRGSPAQPPPPPVDYVAEFRKIAGMGLVARRAHKRHYTLLSETLRRFFEDKAGLEALERTTAEIEAALARIPGFPGEIERRTAAFLRDADLVKFARHVPAAAEAEAGPERGIEIVQGLENWLRERVVSREEGTAEGSRETGPEAPSGGTGVPSAAPGEA